MSGNRWVLKDTTTNETYSMPINPDLMTSPEPDRNLTFAASGFRNERVRTYALPADAKEWQWGGVLRDKAQHDALHDWASRKVPVEVTDHLGRTYRVIITQYDVTDRRPTKTVIWRLRYQMTTRIIRRVT